MEHGAQRKEFRDPKQDNGPLTMRLYVNVDHVATIRQARRTDEPDPVAAAVLCERAGADGITAHLREDRRHIQDDDAERLAVAITTVFNLEIASAPDVVNIAVRLKPHQVTLVPERREEITTEGGLDLARKDHRLAEAVARLSDAGIRVSLFIGPDHATIDAARALAVPAIELHTGAYAHARERPDPELARLAQAARYARSLGLHVHAGHGLTYQNVQPVAAIPEIEELNIGHSIVSRSVYVGLDRAVREMRALITSVR
jgi:pyridoxine 5-phosphate synthase